MNLNMLSNTQAVYTMLKENNKLYRETGVSNISDNQYDLYLDMLSKQEKKDVIDIKIEVETIDETTNEKNINFENKEFSKGNSLEFKKWIKNNNVGIDDIIIISPKLDGVSIIFYNNKCFSKRSSKANTSIDTDLISHRINVNSMFKLSSYLNIAIKCEMVIDKDIFKQKYSLEHKDEYDEDNYNLKKYKSHLNYLTSLLTTKEKHESDFDDVDFIIHSFSEKNCKWNIFKDGIQKFNLNNHLNFHQEIRLKDLFLKFVDNTVIDDANYTSSLLKKFSDLTNSQNYDIDGLVIDLNRIEINPKKYKSIFGYKPPAVGHMVVVKDIQWTKKIGDILVPKIIFDSSIFCNGREIKACSGKNYKYIVENNITIRSIISVSINAGLIPDINSVLTYGIENLYGIEYDPSKHKMDANNVNIILKEEDNNTLANNIFLFYKKKEIKQLGIKTIEKLTNNGIKTINHILDENNKEFILSIKSVGIANYNILISIKNEIFNLTDLIECSPFLLRVNKARLNILVNTGIIYYKDEEVFIKDDIKTDNSAIIKSFKNNLVNFNYWLKELLAPKLINVNL